MLARRVTGGIPANIWSLLEDLEPELREPEYVPGLELSAADGARRLMGGSSEGGSERTPALAKRGRRAANIYKEGEFTEDVSNLDM
jgi:hypothetical protein